MNTETPPINHDQPLKQALSGEGSHNIPRLQRYMETNGSRYRQLTLDEIHGKKVTIKLMVPLTELQGEGKQGNEEWYRDSVRKSLELNDSIFGTTPSEKTYLFLETTDDWNAYINDPQRRKTKGDRSHGSAGEDILCFTPPGMRSETNADLSGISAADYVRTVLDHETAHATIQAKYGRNLTGWMNEAVPMLICTDLAKPVSREMAECISSFFADYLEPPSDKILMNSRYKGREDKGPVMYTYGEFFFKWVVNRFAKEGTDETKKSIIVPLIDRFVAQDSTDFQLAFRDTFGIEYKQAYMEFISYLQSVSSGGQKAG